MNQEKRIPAIDREQFSCITMAKTRYSFRISTTTDFPMDYMYIMKSEVCDNLYKIGKTKNMQERFKTLNSSQKFKKYRFVPFAYSPCNREHSILIGLLASNAEAGYTNPHDNRIRPEVYYLNDDDIHYIMDLFHFRPVNKNNAPQEIALIKKEYIDNLCRTVKVEYIEKFSDGTTI